MPPGVTIEHVSFGYGGTAVLDDINLDVERGEFFAFLGPSGSGKTTLLRLIAGFGVPALGRIVIGERDVTALPPWSRNVGMVFQSYALWPHMTVARNVAFGLERRSLRRAEIAAHADFDTGALDHAADERRHRALAVRSRDADDWRIGGEREQLDVADDFQSAATGLDEER